MPDLSCPRCTSPDVRRFAILHKQGAATTQSVTSVTSVGGEGHAVGTANTWSETTTKLAAETAPPAAKNVLTPGVFAVVSAIGLFSTFGIPGNWRVIWLVILLVSAPLVFARRRYNRDEWPALMRKWDRSFLCLRCGESFEATI